MHRFLILFFLMAAGAFANTATAGSGLFAASGTETDVLTKVLESGGTGLTYAGATILAIRWLGVKLLAAKDAEIEQWRSAANSAVAALSATTEVNRSVTAALLALNNTLGQINVAAEARARECARFVDVANHVRARSENVRPDGP